MGQWADDVQAGEGKCVYADGSTYDGEWQAGARCGAGLGEGAEGGFVDSSTL